VKMAKAKNIQIIPGLEMFVQQGARQFEIWAGKPAPVADMGFVVSKALERIAAQNGDGGSSGSNGATRSSTKPATEPVAPKAAPPVGKKKAKAPAAKPAKKAAKKTSKR